MRLHAKDGVRGELFDLNFLPPKRIRKVIWYDVDTGEYEALKVDDFGRTVRDQEGECITYRGTGRLKFFPATIPPVGTDSHPFSPPAEAPPVKQKVKRDRIPLFTKWCKCGRVANWSVADEIELPPVVVDGKRYAQGKVVARRHYCDFCYQAPRLIHPETGDTLKKFEEAGGVRPQWHSK